MTRRKHDQQPRRRNYAPAIVIGLAALAGAAVIGNNSGDAKEDPSTRVIAHYYGRPIPKSGAIDRLTKFGNIDIQVYADNHADFKVIGKGDRNLLEGDMTCTSDESMHITAHPIAPKIIEKRLKLPSVDTTENSETTRIMCQAGALSIVGMDRVGGFNRIDS